MGKLVFRYGAMNAAKSANLCMMAYNFRSKGLHVFVAKLAMHGRWGEAASTVHSRANLSLEADLLVTESTDLTVSVPIPAQYHCVLVDEAQFLTCAQVEQLRALTRHTNVFCYGLRTHFLTHTFAGSQRLLEVADTIEEIKTTCTQCPRKAIFNAKFEMREGVLHVMKHGGQIIDIGAEEKYCALCWQCFDSAPSV